ncbi:ribonucleoside-diphosphate reductase subunit alpha [Savagea sp. SN6]|uniref:Ribonucleoside-diphosphate reductase n=2 Tax=Savagea serpentis TaxID=2785297 RepID=A0A8J7G3D9_9BACL|nr:ribonucleoside-diphosphate reductase subunit alpha [Savagea serpentis]MBF4501505.1 ribonucleoside-diphosphate reductase subunit alpha [Savagea serpentis]
MTTMTERPVIQAILDDAIARYGQEKVQDLLDASERWLTRYPERSDSEWADAMVLDVLSFIDETAPHWTFVASRIYAIKIYADQKRKRGVDVYTDFAQNVQKLVDAGLYSPVLVEKYTAEELEKAGTFIEKERDELFTYIGLKTFVDRYVAVDYSKEPVELPQERWLVIALTLMQDEAKERRMEYVREAYWAMSSLYMTVATPTLANAGKTHGQLSSCFIDTVDDSLQGIYDSNTDVANLSKFGGGIGVYMGKVRARGSAIRGFKGASSGVLPWIKQLNNTAVSVDQLGQRQGAIAVYLDVWHRDISTFLDLKLNNGDERLRAHDIFTGVCIPDVFMEAVEARGEWHLFDPHEVREVMGFSLEDFYDEKRGEGSFREKYAACVANEELSRETVQAIDIMKRVMRSQLETGTPFMFYRDEVNRANPNKHEGIIYSSNLCTEIAQNMSPTTFETMELEDDVIVTRKKPGDFVVCNLSSINLGKAVPADILERLIPIQVRMLDNVIDLNKIPVLQARRTNERYRGIGLGTFGWHHLLALKGVQWESDEAVEYADELYEKIAYLTIDASSKLAEEKGAYPLFEGSDWETGEYFERRQYESDEWNELRTKVKERGMRNGYLMAVAPNSSTSVIAGSTASIDPIFQPFFHEEKKNYRLPVIAPDLDHNTYDVYRRSAYIVDQRWSVKQNAARQRHIDQAISFNIYVPNTIRASVLLGLHLQAWDSGMKSTYYTRSTASNIEECEWCHS